MQLLTNELRKQLPPLYAQEKRGDDAIAYARFFTPDAQWVWYATEYDGEDTLCGLAFGFEIEFGPFSLSELQAVTGPLGLHVERDLYFKPTTLREIKAQLGARQNCRSSFSPR